MENNPTPLAVVALALDGGDGRWLMHRRPLAKQHGGLWEFPGGKVEAGESPEEALVREIDEELGIAIAARDLVAAGEACSPLDSGERAIVITLYSCARWKGTPCALEGEAVAWFTPGEIAALDTPPLDRALARELFGRWSG